MFNGQGDFFELHRRAFSTGLKVMDARRFLPHLYKVNEAMHEKGVLYGINGNLIERERVVNYTNILNLDCYVYLNGQFKKNNKEKGFRGLDFLEIVDYVQGRYISTRSPLLPCLEESCWADITLESLNRQGFPTKRSPIGDKYEPGKTAYFAIPSESSVVRFGTDSNWAGLDCSSNPDISNSSLGVFTTAEVSLN